jgi:hypothetical protein
MVRGDYSFSDINRFFARLNHYHYTIPKNQMGIPQSIFIEDQVNQGIALDDVAVLSPSLVVNLRYSLTAAEFPEPRASEGTSLTSLGFSPALAALFNSRLSTVPRVSVSPLTTVPVSAFKVPGGLTFVGSGGSTYHVNHGEWLPRFASRGRSRRRRFCEGATASFSARSA